MGTLPANEYVETREGSYYIAGTRVGLDVLVHDFREGESPETILQSYPSIGSLAKVYGAITFILEHPEEIAAYLCEQDLRWDEFREQHPIPEDMLEGFRGAQKTRV
jgi:uncharacterized protein (DUF433 family)